MNMPMETTLDWCPPNTNRMDKITNTIDANTQIFLQIHSSSTRLAPSKPGLSSWTDRWEPPATSLIAVKRKLQLSNKRKLKYR